ncbi:MAG: helix-turn-helix domain-containing protein [Oscillospiraceae bacterium]|nr:helix-turn-helix domain-containing protein [Oscillospiraceae bacterium]
MKIGEKISKLRRENNYTQEQLAEILSVSRQSVSKWETDLTYPETEKIIALSKLFGCSADYLLKDDADESGREVKVKIVEVDSGERNREYINSLLLTYLSFPPLFGFIVAFFSIRNADRLGLRKMKHISVIGMIVSLLMTIIMAVGIIFEL